MTTERIVDKGLAGTTSTQAHPAFVVQRGVQGPCGGYGRGRAVHAFDVISLACSGDL